jgi:hypothetical protein
MFRAKLHREASQQGSEVLLKTTLRGNCSDCAKHRGLGGPNTPNASTVPTDRPKSYDVQATSLGLAMVGALLGKLEGTLHRRPLSKYGRKLPKPLWERCDVSVDCGTLTINPDHPISRRTSLLHGGHAAPVTEVHQISQIVKIEYACHGARSFKVHLRDVNDQYTNYKDAPTCELNSEELEASGRLRNIRVIILEFRTSTAQSAVSWIHKLLLEVSTHAKLTTELAKILVAENPHAPAAESLLRRSITLWKLAFGEHAEHVSEGMQNLATYLLAQPDRAAEAREVQEWVPKPRHVRQATTGNYSSDDEEHGSGVARRGTLVASESDPPVSQAFSRPSLASATSSTWSILGAKSEQYKEKQAEEAESAMKAIRSLVYESYLGECEAMAVQTEQEKANRQGLFDCLKEEEKAAHKSSRKLSRSSASSGCSYLDVLESLI